ncbi:MAG: hypothetical protein NTU91_00090, partial [Chloroflexi bacterium]|nr:hypothetical protein [Chloroflexota bacterium]
MTRGHRRALLCGAIQVAIATVILGCAHPQAHTAPLEGAGLWDAHTHLSWSGAAALDSLVSYGV